jgi:hypothetical protein
MSIFDDFMVRAMEDYQEHGSDCSLEQWLQQALLRMDASLSKDRAEEIMKGILMGIEAYQSSELSMEDSDAMKNDLKLSDTEFNEITKQIDILSNVLVEEIESEKK